MVDTDRHPPTGHWPRSFRQFSLGYAITGIATITVIALILALIYRNILATYTADDIFFKYTANGSYSLALASYVNGRFVPGLLFQLLSVAGIEISTVWGGLQCAAFIAIATLSYVFVTCLNINLSRIETLTITSIIAFLPYNFVLLVNKNNALNATAAYFLIAASILLYTKCTGIRRVIYPALLLFLTASSYQTTIYYFITFIFSFHLFSNIEKKEVITGIFQGLAACALAVTAYLVMYKITAGWAADQMSLYANADVAQHYGRARSGLISFDQLWLSLLLYVHSIGRTLFGNEPILSLSVKLFGACVFFIVYHTWAYKLPGNLPPSEKELFQNRNRRLMLLLLILALGSPIHVMLLFKSLPPRIHAHAGSVWAVLFLTALVYGQERWRKAVLACAALFSMGLAYHTGRIAADIDERYDRDTLLARAIVADIKALPEYRSNSTVAFAGTALEGPRNDKRLFNYYITMMPSKFDKQWAMLGMLEEVTGERFRRPSKTFLEESKKSCLEPMAGEALFHVKSTPKGPVVCLRSSWLMPQVDF